MRAAEVLELKKRMMQLNESSRGGSGEGGGRKEASSEGGGRKEASTPVHALKQATYTSSLRPHILVA